MIDSPTMHQQLKTSLLDKIRSMDINTRLPSERALATEFQVCRATVAKVMEELELEGYLSRRVGKGTFIVPRDREVHTTATTPRTQGQVIIAYPDFFSYWIWSIVHHSEIQAMKNNLRLLNLKFQPESDHTALLNLIKNTDNLRGIIIHPGGSFVSTALLKNLDELSVPTIIIGRLEQQRSYRQIYEVSNDHFRSGYLKAECLLKNGHRKIALVNNEPLSECNEQSRRGIKQAVFDYGLRWKDLIQPQMTTQPWEDPMQAGYFQAMEILSTAPDTTAMICDTNTGAIGALRAIYENGKRCPDDISIVTAMEFFHLEEFTCPKLSTVVSSTEHTIQAALDIILDPNPGRGRNVTMNMTLIERESVKNIGEKLS